MNNIVQEFKEAVTRRYTSTAAVTAADVVDLGDIYGIACDTYAASVEGAYAVKGRFDLDKDATVEIAAGEGLYWDSDNEQVTSAPDGRFIGVAAEDAASTATTIETDLNAVLPVGNIAVYGETGEFKNSYPTIDSACEALEDNDILKLRSGEYTLLDEIDITALDCQIIGIEPGVVIVGAAGADYCFKTVFGAITSTKGITFSEMTIDHGDDATQMGIVIENTSATGRINAYINNVSSESDGGDAINVGHASTSASVRLYVKGGTLEGPVNYTVGHTDDRIRFEGSTLRGGLVTGTSATAMEIELWNCKILHEGVTGGNAAQLLYALYCLSETDANPNVYAALDTSDLAGSHTESVLFPAS